MVQHNEPIALVCGTTDQDRGVFRMNYSLALLAFDVQQENRVCRSAPDDQCLERARAPQVDSCTVDNPNGCYETCVHWTS